MYNLYIEYEQMHNLEQFKNFVLENLREFIMGPSVYQKTTWFLSFGSFKMYRTGKLNY